MRFQLLSAARRVRVAAFTFAIPASPKLFAQFVGRIPDYTALNFRLEVLRDFRLARVLYKIPHSTFLNVIANFLPKDSKD